ncbi:glycosyltransferase family 4 protein [Solwaraspora sp. WMMD1047]|uniref:glycosyltransferase family 4 protein n=1 Tax=Solwaraspora sp. WMMD1047 TaxID=3016102 RepID=UPI002416BB8F|nr:glycosyltransferase family 4 protein [Solwaraspora sp. WMMD1047]MDG4831685.1 glycosyltransferase family 4 protein [Solwaraspora sp. WMMD1047]
MTAGERATVVTGPTPTGGRRVYLVVPAGIDDPAAPSGGNSYDRQLSRGLAAAGWRVDERLVGGPWPRPGPAGRAELAATLAAVPDDAVLLLDGLVGCAVPELVTPAAERLRLAVLVHLPLGDETGLEPREAAELDALERRTLRAAAAVVATSAATGRRLVDQHGLPADRVHVAVPGVEPAPPAPGSTAGSRLLCVAAVTPRKGQDVLVEALAGLTDLSWDCRFVGALAAAPDHVDRLRRSAARAGVADRLRFTGPLAGTALATEYAGTDLLILPSHAETYGMVVTEALARAIPVLATRVGGVPEALGRGADGDVPGMLVPPGEPAALGAALRRWLTEPDTRRRWRAAAAARRDGLPRWPATARTVAEVLERLDHEPRRNR